MNLNLYVSSCVKSPSIYKHTHASVSISSSLKSLDVTFLIHFYRSPIKAVRHSGHQRRAVGRTGGADACKRDNLGPSFFLPHVYDTNLKVKFDNQWP